MTAQALACKFGIVMLLSIVLQKPQTLWPTSYILLLSGIRPSTRGAVPPYWPIFGNPFSQHRMLAERSTRPPIWRLLPSPRLASLLQYICLWLWSPVQQASASYSLASKTLIKLAALGTRQLLRTLIQGAHLRAAVRIRFWGCTLSCNARSYQEPVGMHRHRRTRHVPMYGRRGLPLRLQCTEAHIASCSGPQEHR